MKPVPLLPSLLFLVLSFLIPQLSLAEGEPQQAHGNNHQSRLLMHLLKLDAAELAELRLTLERIEEMTPDEKEAFTERVQRLHALPSKTAQKLYQGYQSIPPQERVRMHQRWREMSPEERKAWRQEMNDLEPGERLQRIKEQGILPGHRYGGIREGMAIQPKPSPAAKVTPKPAETEPESPAPVEEN